MNHYTAIVSFELAKKLKMAGYDKDYGYQYDNDGELVDPASPGGYEGICEAPTYAEVLDWLFRHGIYVSVSALITSSHKERFIGSIITPKRDMSFGYRDTFKEAITPAIEKALEILKEKDNENN